MSTQPPLIRLLEVLQDAGRKGSLKLEDIPEELRSKIYPAIDANLVSEVDRYEIPSPPGYTWKRADQVRDGDTIGYGNSAGLVEGVRIDAWGVHLYVKSWEPLLYNRSGKVMVYAGPFPERRHWTEYAITPDGVCYLRKYLQDRLLQSEPDEPPAPDPEGGPETETAKPVGLSRQEVAERLKEIHKRGERWTSYRDMARRIGCSTKTVHDAIHDTPELEGWAPKQTDGPPRAQSITEVVTDGIAQSRELDPADEASIREFRETLDGIPDPKQRKEAIDWFEALSTEALRDIADDPGKYRKILGRKP